MRGRKPKPTALKLVAGNPGKRPLNMQEPQPELLNSPIKPPVWLNKPAKDEWKVQIKYLAKNRVLGANELSILLQYCQLYGAWVEAAKSGKRFSTADIIQIRGFRADLGIGPSVRSKFKTGVTEPKDNKWEAFK